MGLLESIILTFRADTSDLKAKLKEVSGLERKAVKEQIEMSRARNEAIDSYISKLAKVNLAVQSVQAVVDGLGTAYEKFDQRQDLSAGSSMYNLERLRKASIGLKTDTELLRVAQASQQTTFKLTQQQLEMATRAMRAFEQAGFDGVEVQQKVEAAIRQGSIRPLKELGVNLKQATGEYEQFTQLMGVLADRSKEANATIEDQGDAFKAAGVRWKNAVEDVQIAIGGLVVQLAPLVEALAAVVELVAKIVAAAPGVIAGGVRTAAGGAASAARAVAPGFVDSLSSDVATIARGFSSGAIATDTRIFGGLYGAQQNQAVLDELRATLSNLWVQTSLGHFEDATEVNKKAKGGGYKTKRRKQPTPFDMFATGALTGEDRRGATYTGSLSDFYGEPALGGAATAMSPLSVGREGLAQGRTYEEFLSQSFSSEPLLEKMFGPIEQFNAYASAFDGLSSVVMAGFTAWMTGAESFGSAMKKALAAYLTNTASELAMQALKHTAYAVGALAFGDPRGAATHGIAAAKFAAGAAAAGLLAHQANAAWNPAAGAGASPSAPNVGGRGAVGGGGGSNITVVIGDSMANDSPRWRQRETARAIRRARRELDDGGGGVIYQ